MFQYGNPILLEGSGRIKTDPLNEQRIELVLARFEEWARANGKADSLRYIINKEQSTRSAIAFPAAGFAVTLVTCSSESSLPTPSSTPTPSTSASVSPS
jgi:hypothetical protein